MEINKTILILGSSVTIALVWRPGFKSMPKKEYFFSFNYVNWVSLICSVDSYNVIETNCIELDKLIEEIFATKLNQIKSHPLMQ
mgnify:CR=1 FL=1